MESNDIYLHLSSETSRDYFPWNTNSNFTTKLPFHLTLDPSRWEVALLQIRCPASKAKSQILIKSDIIYDVIYQQDMIPILRWMEINTRTKLYDIQVPFYHTLKKKDINQITIKIENPDRQAHSFSNSQAVQCVLHFRKKKKE